MTPAYFQKKYEALERAKTYNAELRERQRDRASRRTRELASFRAKRRYIQSKLEVLSEEMA